MKVRKSRSASAALGTATSPLGVAASAVLLVSALLVCAGASRAGAVAQNRVAAKGGGHEQTRLELEQRFTTTVTPFIKAYCISCHGKDRPQAQLDLSSYTNVASAARDYPHWAHVLERLAAKQMPPAGSKQPPAVQSDAVIGWIRGLRRYEAERNAGDPGTVLARRLSNAEYDYTLRDLTGQDLRPTREFPVDPANQEGFDNSGESLTLSPALMKKYLGAARQVADHLVPNSQGIAFAPHPVLAETDRDKYAILRIVDFYKRQPTDPSEYFLAAWAYRHRAALGKPAVTLAQVATDAGVSPRYLETVWKALNMPGEKVGPMAGLQERWNALPAPAAGKPEALQQARTDCEAIQRWVTRVRKKVAWKFSNLPVPGGFSPGGQAFILWKNRQYATHRRLLFTDALQVGGKPKPRVEIPGTAFGGNKAPVTVVDPPDPELFVPEDEAARAPYLDSFKRFCSIFPDAYYISERGRMHIEDAGDKGRFLSAGFHNMMGYFRDDTPLMEMVLDEAGRRELDQLWLDFDFVAAVPERMHLEFIFYERAESGTIKGREFDFARSEDKDATTDAKIQRLGEVYLAKAARSGGNPVVLQAIQEHFRLTSVNIRAIQKVRAAAQPTQINALVDFARRAYRRPLTAEERTNLQTFYRTLREKEGLGHDEALRDGVVSVLMSPHFLFRMDLEEPAPVGGTRTGSQGSAGIILAAAKAPKKAPARAVKPAAPQSDGSGIQPLSDYALANRLSYFLWSSMPDEELLARAAAGDLRRPEVLASQARRMLQSPKVRAMALEWGGNWLDFRRFEEHNAVDRERFPTFNDDLRQAMFEEPVRFLMDQFQGDRSVLDMLYGKHTFVNAVLARHYGMKDVKAPGNSWVRVENAEPYGRGGLLPMSVFLTQNSPGLRTSPVKRGYWVVRRVLGEHIPPPPAVVPDLPADEGKLGDLTLRQVLAKHRENVACAGCHARFDSYGLVFEGYGPTGELRTKDLGGKAVDARAPFPGGEDRTGLTGLQAFLTEQRQSDFLDNLCRKLLSYSLGRTLQPSDDLTLQQMRQKLAAGGNRFGTLVETIVTSRQFRYRRTVPSLAAG